VNFEVCTELQLKCPSFMDMTLHQLVTGSLYICHHITGKRKGSLGLGCLDSEFFKISWRDVQRLHHTGVPGKF